MKTRLINLWQRLRCSFWFLPSLLVLAAFLTAQTVLAIDDTAQRDGVTLPRAIYRGGAEGARAVLSVIAGAMISVTGITFSINCIDRLGASLSKLAERATPSGFRYDEDNRLRVVTDVDTFKGVLNTAFDQIRQNGRTNAAVTIRLLEIIGEIALHVHSQAHRAALLRQAAMIERGSRTGLPEDEDRNDAEARYQEVVKALQPLK